MESYNKLNVILKKGKLIISAIVASELGSQFKTASELETFLKDTRIEIIPSSITALFKAGHAYVKYLAKREIICHSCGNSLENLSCFSCKSKLKIRQHILPDFLIAAHALGNSNGLVTRDLGYYKSYFPELQLI